jgi:hypothetical protein
VLWGCWCFGGARRRLAGAAGCGRWGSSVVVDDRARRDGSSRLRASRVELSGRGLGLCGGGLDRGRIILRVLKMYPCHSFVAPCQEWRIGEPLGATADPLPSVRSPPASVRFRVSGYRGAPRSA